jgi:hypothetical protein
MELAPLSTFQPIMQIALSNFRHFLQVNCRAIKRPITPDIQHAAAPCTGRLWPRKRVFGFGNSVNKLPDSSGIMAAVC